MNQTRELKAKQIEWCREKWQAFRDMEAVTERVRREAEDSRKVTQ